MHIHPRLKRMNGPAQIQAQQLLVSYVEQICTAKKTKARLIFDGRSPGNISHAEKVTIFHSGKQKTADQLIISMVPKLIKKNDVFVVTNDREVRSKCTQKGAEIIKSSDFIKLLPGIESQIEKSTKGSTKEHFYSKQATASHAHVSKREVDEMLLYLHLRDMDENDESDT